jgi:NitT/TauT family transport system permease protein
MKSRILSLIFFPLLLLLWQITALSGAVSPILMPPLERVGAALYRNLTEGDLARQLLYSLFLVSGGTVIGLTGGAALVFLAGMHRQLRSLVGQLQALLHPLPGIALLPLVLLWAGTGTPAVLLVMVHSSLWPIYLNLQSGRDEIPKRYLAMAANWEMKKLALLLHIIFPAIFPSLIAGLRTGWARSWRALIAAEMVFGAAGYYGGLGWFLFERRVYMDSAGLYGGILVVMLAGLATDRLLFAYLEAATDRRWGRVHHG